MRIYEFKCEDCGNIFELLEDKALKLSCSICGSEKIKRLFSSPLIAKDFAKNEGKTCCGKDERCSTPPCGNNGECVR